MRKASKTIYKVSIYVYLALAVLFAVLAVLYFTAFTIGKPEEQVWKNIGTGIALVIASSISCCESIFARRALNEESTNITGLVWGIIGVVASYSSGALLLVGAILGLVVDNQENNAAKTDVIEAPKDEEEPK